VFICVRMHFQHCIAYELCQLRLALVIQFSILSRRDRVPYTEPLVAIEEAESRRTFTTDLSITFVSSVAGR
jgi:hypothetical protein